MDGRSSAEAEVGGTSLLQEIMMLTSHLTWREVVDLRGLSHPLDAAALGQKLE